MNSVNRSINKLGDSEDDIMTVNHTFYFSVRGDNMNNINYGLKLMLKFNEHNIGKQIYIHPLKTWMCIELVG